jgi:sugar/nucleoside kinase (ribokinase family)
VKKPTCFGSGLVALDVILNGSPSTLPKLSVGGSCGNVLSILGYLGWNSYPVARLAENAASEEVLRDLKRWNIHTDHISTSVDGSTPIIIHRILKDGLGKPIHRFEFKDPITKSWLPQFKPITKNIASEILQENLIPDVFYFDRMNPGTFDIVTQLKAHGTIIYFEPSSISDIKQFEKFLSLADVVKYSHDRIPNYKETYPSNQCFLEIETRGEAGLLYRCKNMTKSGDWRLIAGFQLPYVQDAAGAGDWCTGGIIKSLCTQGRDFFFNIQAEQIEEALQFGQAFGAMNCLYDGARGLMYFLRPEELLHATQMFIEQRSLSAVDLPKVPIIDISTYRKFSELY